ncbi:MAG: malic enzyme-like NAD(P)-binding protein [Gammaproteobacteria bacterium]|jgi:malate dehydrogenase (oxaloacetate-decarboxylating)(NADP+)
MKKIDETQTDLASQRKQRALDYHAKPFPGKTGTALTKPCETQQELSLAYTPGVAAPVREIARDAELAYRYTNKGNLVAVITDGTAVLGLGNVGPLAGKPVMEGKCVLFKRFADIDAIDLEVAAPSPETFVETVVHLAPSFGGINLEDIAAPHCFYIEQALQKRLDIPVFHDDQHGTAIIIAAGLLNALELQGKRLEQARIVCLGAGAAALASLRLLQTLGASVANIRVLDRKGVLHEGREDINEFKRSYAGPFSERTLTDAMVGADVLLGLSGPNLVNEDMIRSMAAKPIVFALSNPDPEIKPELAKSVRPDLIMATGRSDYPNQVNNVLGFPFIFRGALDVRARSINSAMMVAAAQALARLAHEPVPDSVLQIYQRESMAFGPDYIIPTPFDPRLKEFVADAVARAAVESGVARVDSTDTYPPVRSD